MLGVAGSSVAKDDDDRGNDFSARLSGFNEVHFDGKASPPTLRGAISTKASGSFRLKIDEQLNQINYELTYQDLVGTVTQAHIHFAQREHRRDHGLALPDCSARRPRPRPRPGHKIRYRDRHHRRVRGDHGRWPGHLGRRGSPHSSRQCARATYANVHSSVSVWARSAARSTSAAGTARANSGKRGHVAASGNSKARHEPGFFVFFTQEEGNQHEDRSLPHRPVARFRFLPHRRWRSLSRRRRRFPR